MRAHLIPARREPADNSSAAAAATAPAATNTKIMASASKQDSLAGAAIRTCAVAQSRLRLVRCALCVVPVPAPLLRRPKLLVAGGEQPAPTSKVGAILLLRRCQFSSVQFSSARIGSVRFGSVLFCSARRGLAHRQLARATCAHDKPTFRSGDSLGPFYSISA